MATHEKKVDSDSDVVPRPADSEQMSVEQTDDSEVFKKDGQVNYRSVGWFKASFIMLKVIFSLGILSIPSAFQVLGVAPGVILCTAWTVLNGYCALVQGNFRNNHRGIHTIADMGGVMWGPWGKEAVGAAYILTYTLVAGNAVIAVSTGLNAVSKHAICTNWFNLVAIVAAIILASYPKFNQIGWLAYIGCISIVSAVFIVVVAVGVVSRPAAAPPTGPFDLGFIIAASPSFADGFGANNLLFFSSAGTSAFIPVIAEMRNPRDFPKSIVLCLGFTTVSYVILSAVMYRYCGQFIANPSLGSAGGVVKKVAFGVALPGLLMTTVIVLHVASKYLFVRVLRHSQHLQKKTKIHYSVWFACTTGLGIIGFIIASAIPFFGQLIGLISSFCLAPLALSFPAILWFYDYGRKSLKSGFRGIVLIILHVMLFCLGILFWSYGTYVSIKGIVDAYNANAVSSAFSCADNSGSV